MVYLSDASGNCIDFAAIHWIFRYARCRALRVLLVLSDLVAKRHLTMGAENRLHQR
jgi:hypothetical protein